MLQCGLLRSNFSFDILIASLMLKVNPIPHMGTFALTTRAQNGAGEGSRTLVFSLEGCCTTVVLHPHTPLFRKNCSPKLERFSPKWWKGVDSNHRTQKRADLQSAAINHSATFPTVQPLIKRLDCA